MIIMKGCIVKGCIFVSKDCHNPGKAVISVPQL